MELKQVGPMIETRTDIRCRPCQHLGTRKSYGSNDYEEIYFVCEASAQPKPLPGSGDHTPEWCPFWPKEWTRRGEVTNAYPT